MKRGTPDHPKTKQLARALGINRAWAIGILEALWHFTSKFAQQGDIGRHPDVDIAEGCYWTRKPEILIAALVEAKWLDSCEKHRLLVHDWHVHADDAVRKYLARNGLDFVHSRDNVETQSGQSRDKNRLPSPSPVPEPSPEPSPSPEPPAALSHEEDPNSEKALKHYHPDTRTVIHYLNEKAGRQFRETGQNMKFISSRLREPGVSLDGVKQMIDRQCAKWLGTDMADYLRPETLFNATKFDGYYAAKDQPVTTHPTKPGAEEGF